MSLHVAVCIVGFRNAQDVADCVASLLRSTHSCFEVLICENGGEEAHQRLVASLSELPPSGKKIEAILAPRNLGYADGVNRCIEASPDAGAWWVLNPDTLVDPDALEKLVAKLTDGSCEAVAGIMYYGDGTVESYGGRWRPWIGRAESIGHGRSVDEPVDASWVLRRLSYIPGGSMLVGRAFLEAVGPMREDYFLYCEEVEWSLRALQNGLRLGFAPGARVLHNQGATTGSGGELKQRPKLPIYLDERNKLLVTRDQFSARLPVAAAASFLLIFARYARRGAWAQLRYALQGWSAGILNKRGIPEWMQHADASAKN